MVKDRQFESECDGVEDDEKARGDGHMQFGIRNMEEHARALERRKRRGCLERASSVHCWANQVAATRSCRRQELKMPGRCYGVPADRSFQICPSCVRGIAFSPLWPPSSPSSSPPPPQPPQPQPAACDYMLLGQPLASCRMQSNGRADICTRRPRGYVANVSRLLQDICRRHSLHYMAS